MQHSFLSQCAGYLPTLEEVVTKPLRRKCTLCGSPNNLVEVGKSEQGYWCMECQSTLDRGFNQQEFKSKPLHFVIDSKGHSHLVHDL